MSLDRTRSSHARSLFRLKPVGKATPQHGPQLKRSITTFQLTMLGVGSTVGTGIFFVLSSAVPEAGPAVILSFLLAGLAAGLAAICYAEMASSVPVSGSSYSCLQLAHVLQESLTVLTVVPRQWSTPSFARVDGEFGQFAQEMGEHAESEARAYLAEPSATVTVDYRTVPGRSVTTAILQAAQDCDASMLVLGSSTRGSIGKISVGSITEKLLHASPIALALAPRGYRSTAADGFSRVTCAFSDSEQSVAVVKRAAELGQSLEVPTRVASFGVRHPTMFPPEIGFSAEDSVQESWKEQASAAQRALLAEGVIQSDTETVIATGDGWEESMSSIDWKRDEVLVLGSSVTGPIARVFLGSRAAKLIRHSAVPVVVLPRQLGDTDPPTQ